MAGRWRAWGPGIAGVLAAGLAFLAGHDGGGRPPALPATQPGTDLETDAREEEPERQPGPAWVESFGDLLGRTFRAVGAQGTALRERAEGFYGAYRLLRALGMSDAEIAAFIAGQARSRLERELGGHTLTAADMRKVLDGVQDTVVRAAEEVDVRLDLGGDFVRRVREGVQATRTGREDALAALERGVATGKEQLRKLLSEGTGDRDQGTGKRE